MILNKDINERGYIYLDILVGLLILGIGMVACIQINNDVVRQKAENANYLRAIQIAASSMDELIEGFKENPALISEYLQEEVSNQKEQHFKQIILVEKDTGINLLTIRVAIKWTERGQLRDYTIETNMMDEEDR